MSVCSVPPSATLIICDPRQMPSIGKPRRQGRLEQVELQLVALGIDAHVGQNLSAIDLRADIVAAADDEALQRLRRQRFPGHETDGARAGAGERQPVHEIAAPSAAAGTW